MNQRDAIEVAAAALRWHTTYERRRAAGAQKRLADHAYKTMGYLSGDLWRAVDASAQVTEAKRQERAALRVLAKACTKVRGDLQDVDAATAPPQTILLITERAPRTKDTP